MSINGAFAYENNQVFDWSKVEASPEDFISLAQYSLENDVKVTKINDDRFIKDIITSVSSNAEFRVFSKFTRNNLFNSHKGTFFIGKTHNKYDVYLSVFEFYDEVRKQGSTLTLYYDADRELLLDAIKSTYNGDTVTVEKRNSSEGEIYRGSLTELKKSDCKECQQMQQPDRSNKVVDAVKSLVIDDSASASGCQVACLPDSSCKWVAVVTCKHSCIS